MLDDEIRVNDYVLVIKTDCGNGRLIDKIGVVKKMNAYKKDWVAVRFEEELYGLHKCEELFSLNCGYFIPLTDLRKLHQVALI
jgi:hypothetical protein